MTEGNMEDPSLHDNGLPKTVYHKELNSDQEGITSETRKTKPRIIPFSTMSSKINELKVKLRNNDVNNQTERRSLLSIIKNKVKVLFNNRKSFTYAVSNVGMDGGLAKLNEAINRNNSGNLKVVDYRNECFEKIIDNGKVVIKVLENSKDNSLKEFRDQLKKIVNLKPVPSDGKTFFTEKEVFTKEEEDIINKLVEFLSDHNNCRKLVEADKAYMAANKKVGEYEKSLAIGYTDPIFKYYNLIKVFNRLTDDEKNDLENVKTYVKVNVEEVIKDRLKEIENNDVILTHELDIHSDLCKEIAKNQDKQVFIGSDLQPSIIINKRRFSVNDINLTSFKNEGDNISDSSCGVVRVYAHDGVKDDGKKSKIKFNLNDDGSISSEGYRIVLAYDLKTKKNILFCSIGLLGYGIGTQKERHDETYNKLKEIQFLLNKLAKDNNVSATVVGGDFNSVKEKVGEEGLSPLGALKHHDKQRNITSEDPKHNRYRRLKFDSATEVAPSGFMQTGYSAVRQIDHVFLKVQKNMKVKTFQGDVAGRPIGSMQTQHEEVYDHKTIFGNIEVKSKFGFVKSKAKPVMKPTESQTERFHKIRQDAIKENKSVYVTDQKYFYHLIFDSPSPNADEIFLELRKLINLQDNSENQIKLIMNFITYIELGKLFSEGKLLEKFQQEFIKKIQSLCIEMFPKNQNSSDLNLDNVLNFTSNSDGKISENLGYLLKYNIVTKEYLIKVLDEKQQSEPRIAKIKEKLQLNGNAQPLAQAITTEDTSEDTSEIQKSASPIDTRRSPSQEEQNEFQEMWEQIEDETTFYEDQTVKSAESPVQSQDQVQSTDANVVSTEPKEEANIWESSNLPPKVKVGEIREKVEALIEDIAKITTGADGELDGNSMQKIINFANALEKDSILENANPDIRNLVTNYLSKLEQDLMMEGVISSKNQKTPLNLNDVVNNLQKNVLEPLIEREIDEGLNINLRHEQVELHSLKEDIKLKEEEEKLKEIIKNAEAEVDLSAPKTDEPPQVKPSSSEENAVWTASIEEAILEEPANLPPNAEAEAALKASKNEDSQKADRVQVSGKPDEAPISETSSAKSSNDTDNLKKSDTVNQPVSAKPKRIIPELYKEVKAQLNAKMTADYKKEKKVFGESESIKNNLIELWVRSNKKEYKFTNEDYKLIDEAINHIYDLIKQPIDFLKVAKADILMGKLGSVQKGMNQEKNDECEQLSDSIEKVIAEIKNKEYEIMQGVINKKVRKPLTEAQTQAKLNKEMNLSNTEENLEVKTYDEAHFSEAENKTLAYVRTSDHIKQDFTKSTVIKGMSTAITTLTNYKDPSLPPVNEDRAIATRISISDQITIPVFGVFDGHAGDQTSQYLEKNLAEYLQQELKKTNLQDTEIYTALRAAFVKCNHAFKQQQLKTDRSGSTAVVALVINGSIWVANAGDSRAIVVDDSQVRALSEDASPDTERFKNQAEKLAGSVKGDRLEGMGVARSFGDTDVQGMIALPKITKLPLSELGANPRLILACDGLFDVASTKEVAKVVQDSKDESTTQLAEKLAIKARNAADDHGNPLNQDDITVVVADLSTISKPAI